MDFFYMNGYLWQVEFVDPDCPELIDRSQKYRVATTDPLHHRIYLSNRLGGEFLQRVFLHELGHATMISYHLLEELHRMVFPEYWIEMEEWICNFLADYGFRIFQTAYSILGEDAWRFVAKKMEDLFVERN